MTAPFAFARTVVACGVLGWIACLAINALVDPFDVLGTSVLPRYGGLQERYLKVQYLRRHPDPDTFLLGSSRVGTTRAEDVERAFPGARAYNLAVSQANEWDAWMLARWLVSTRPAVRRLFVQVDWPTSFGPDKPGHGLLTAMPPAITGEDSRTFAARYVASISLDAIALKLAYNLGSAEALEYSIERGSWSRPARDATIEADCAATPGRHRFLPRAASAPAKSSTLQRRIIDRNVEALRSLVAMARARGVQAVLYLTPHHRSALDRVDASDYAYWLRGLASVASFYNFAFYSDITTDDCAYYEGTHHRSAAAARVYRLIAAGHTVDGAMRRVDRNNIDAEIAFARANFARHRGP